MSHVYVHLREDGKNGNRSKRRIIDDFVRGLPKDKEFSSKEVSFLAKLTNSHSAGIHLSLRTDVKSLDNGRWRKL